MKPPDILFDSYPRLAPVSAPSEENGLSGLAKMAIQARESLSLAAKKLSGDKSDGVVLTGESLLTPAPAPAKGATDSDREGAYYLFGL